MNNERKEIIITIVTLTFNFPDCHGLDPSWSGLSSEPEVFLSGGSSINTGQVVTLTCDTGMRLFGNKEVTCYSGTYYTFTRVPHCVPPG